jgi:hypothetical protein
MSSTDSTNQTTAFGKIEAGLKEAIAVAKGEDTGAVTHTRTTARRRRRKRVWVPLKAQLVWRYHDRVNWSAWSSIHTRPHQFWRFA